jgi:phenol 2-monooxygenase
LSFDESQAEYLDAYPIEVVLQHLTEEETSPHQSTATNGAAKSDGLFRSNMAADDTEELLSKAAANSRAGAKETVRAKYMIGCDGAHSWVRNQLDYKLEGEQTDYIWYEKGKVGPLFLL